MRYILFTGLTYYPYSGINDLSSRDNDANELIKLISYKLGGEVRKKINQEAPHPILDKGTVRLDIIEQRITWINWYHCEDDSIDWWHIYDTQEGEIIYGSQEQGMAGELPKSIVEKTLLHPELKNTTE